MGSLESNVTMTAGLRQSAKVFSRTAKYQTNKRTLAKESGMCGECCYRPRDGEKTRCGVCAQRQRDYYAAKKKPKRVAIAKVGKSSPCGARGCRARAVAGMLFCQDDGRRYAASLRGAK